MPYVAVANVMQDLPTECSFRAGCATHFTLIEHQQTAFPAPESGKTPLSDRRASIWHNAGSPLGHTRRRTRARQSCQHWGVTEQADHGDIDARLAELAERETAYGLFQRAKAMLKRRHYAQGAVLLERASRLEPGKGSIIEDLARAYYNSGQHRRAAERFRELIEIDPSAAYGHFGLGQSLKQLGNKEEARLHLRLAVALAPDSSLYLNALKRLGSAK